VKKSKEEIMRDVARFSTIPGCKRVIGYGSYFTQSKRFDASRSDIDICVEVKGDPLSAMPTLRELEEAGVSIGRGPGQYHIWILHESSLRPSKLTGPMHEHSEAINRDGVTLWEKKY